MADPYDAVLLGSGPAGYVAAIRGAQLGLRVAVVESDDLGGVCLNWGCIPSKALLHNAQLVSTVRDRGAEFGMTFTKFQADYGVAVDRSRGVVKTLTTGVGGLLKKNKVDVIKGRGTLKSATRIEVGKQTVEGKNILIATGGRARSLPGIEIDGEIVVTSREAIVQQAVPKKAVIIGGGVIGAEFAYIWHSYGAEVTILEALSRLLPTEDDEISVQLKKDFEKLGMTVKTGAKVSGVSVKGKTATVSLDGGESILADRVMVAIGIQGNIEDIGLEAVGVTTEKSWITADEMGRTNVPGVWAIGDVTGRMLLAHVAFRQGEIAMEMIAGHQPAPIDYAFVPRATYCHPQVASVGYTEAQVKEQGVEYVAAKFPFRGIGKAIALGDAGGFIKVIAGKQYGEILGAHLIGPEVTELLPELTLAHAAEAGVLDIGETIHAHPTLSEVLKEGSLAALGRAIHY